MEEKNLIMKENILRFNKKLYEGSYYLSKVKCN